MDTTYLLGVMGLANAVGKVVLGRVVDVFRGHIFSLTAGVMMVMCVGFGTGDFLPSLPGQALGTTSEDRFLDVESISTTDISMSDSCP